MKPPRTTADGGFTLVELMFSAAVMTIGAVLILNAMVNIAHQSQVANSQMNATNFNQSVLESLRGRAIEDILQFNEGNSEFQTTDDGKILIEGVGFVDLDVWAIVPGDGGAVSRVSIPMSDETMDSVLTTLPNPVEVQAQVSVDKGFGEGHKFKFTSSTKVFYR